MPEKLVQPPSEGYGLGRIVAPPRKWRGLWQELVDRMLTELGEGETAWELTVPEGRPARLGAGPGEARWRSVTLVRRGRWHPPHPDYVGSGHLLLPVLEGESDPFRAGYGGNPPRRAFECAVCGKTKRRNSWSGGIWRGLAMCSECDETTEPVTFHATWTERMPRSEGRAVGDEFVVEGNPLAVTRVEDKGGNVAIWLASEPAKPAAAAEVPAQREKPGSKPEWEGQRYVDRTTGREIEELRNTEAAIPHNVGNTVSVRRRGRSAVYVVVAVEGDTVLVEPARPGARKQPEARAEPSVRDRLRKGESGLAPRKRHR